ncbi:hypothetical protein VOLCADRAFT_88639 [Volvox carteri f. nagariensis]|uniref:DNA mismatch repair proteins mutS family domain-containing protein n=1 Tax=Volvox carteri f. nagariensis TaxID=3068 RepID=D8TPJ4_VOLCA|nr:uncharacterized protein VOLCADRAFT_88639 [Volvox carteri f. nagariensis]EFJ50776.1 hypothetical protein VOLCADRAFT_88639 [Volvox carteri f. nagariensis]|eukprot:XP_002948369.1 hypothetical protein VOLCADRAFT_88639 [Volvox carteri f. nagariensis]
MQKMMMRLPQLWPTRVRRVKSSIGATADRTSTFSMSHRSLTAATAASPLFRPSTIGPRIASPSSSSPAVISAAAAAASAAAAAAAPVTLSPSYPGTPSSRLTPGPGRLHQTFTPSRHSTPPSDLLAPSAAQWYGVSTASTICKDADMVDGADSCSSSNPETAGSISSSNPKSPRKRGTAGAGSRATRGTTGSETRSSAADKSYKTEAVMTPEAAVYWRRAMEAIDRPGLGLLLGSLEWDHPLGVSSRRARGRVQCYDSFLAAKRKHPTAVVLVRIGEFYEAVGFDALVLCQYGGLNPMSPHTGVAEAGFPRAANSLRRQLNRLIGAGFTVAMVEEVREVRRSGSAVPFKERKLVAVVSSSSPYYLYGDVEDEYEGDDTPLPKPIMGISVPSSGGYRLMRYCPQRRTVQVLSQLSTEALVSYLHATGVAQPLRLHTSVREREKMEGRGPPLARVLSSLLGTTVEEYGIGAGSDYGIGTPARPSPTHRSSRVNSGFDDVSGFKRVVAATLGLDPDGLEAIDSVPFAYESSPSPSPASPYNAGSIGSVAPLPPSLSTATQLGLAGARGVPSLLSAALPEGTPALAREWLRRLLLLPPPPTVAEDIRAVCMQLAGSGEDALPLPPPLVTSVPGPRIAALLGEGAAGHNTLRDLRTMLIRVSELLSLPGPRARVMHCALGGVLEWSLNVGAGLTWAQVPAHVFAAHCTAAADAIAQVVPPLLAANDPGSLESSGAEKDDDCSDGERYGALSDSYLGSLEDSDDLSLGAQDGGETESAGGTAAATSLSAVLLPYIMASMAGAGTAAAPATGPSQSKSSSYLTAQMSFLRRRAWGALGVLVERMEKFRLAVREERMQAAVDKVSSCRAELVAALVELVSALEAGGAGNNADVRLAAHDDAVWARLSTFAGGVGRRKMPAAQQRSVVEAVRRASGLELIHPLNRKRGVEGDRYSSVRLEAAAADYRLAVDLAEKEARRVLRELCSHLHGAGTAGGGGAPHHLMTLLAAAELSVAFTALERHVARTKQAGWNWPAMPAVHSLSPSPSQPEAQGTGVSGSVSGFGDVRLCLPGLWPYWMDKRGAVANDISLAAGRMALLTGPNMAGKSTVLRSVAAAALLATCGLSVPAGPAGGGRTANTHTTDHVQCTEDVTSSWSSPGASPSPSSPPSTDFFVPWLSHVSLRNFSGDSPLEGKSAFAVEMEDTAHTLAVAQSAGPRCLVLLDELGKGTEVVSGSALAAAVVEQLVTAGVAGVFATHLHDLAYLLRPLQQAGRLEYWAMQVAEAPPAAAAAATSTAASLPLPLQLQPTRRVLVGQTCLRSLALQVAAACGMQADVLAAAARYETLLSDVMQRVRQSMYGDMYDSTYGGVGVAERLDMTRVMSGSESARDRMLRLGGAAAGIAVQEDEPAAAAVRDQESLGSRTSGDLAAEAPSLYDWQRTAISTATATATAAAVQENIFDGDGPCPPRAAAAVLLLPAAEMLREAVRRAMAAAGGGPIGPDAGQLHWVRPEWRPAPGHVGEAVVYILLRLAGCGKRNATSLHCVYSVIPRSAGGKSAALDVEAELIGRLQREGWELKSDHDKKRDGLHRPQLPVQT